MNDGIPADRLLTMEQLVDEAQSHPSTCTCDLCELIREADL